MRIFTSVKVISNPFKFLCWSGRSKSGSDKIELIFSNDGTDFGKVIG